MFFLLIYVSCTQWLTWFMISISLNVFKRFKKPSYLCTLRFWGTYCDRYMVLLIMFILCGYCAFLISNGILIFVFCVKYWIFFFFLKKKKNKNVNYFAHSLKSHKSSSSVDWPCINILPCLFHDFLNTFLCVELLVSYVLVLVALCTCLVLIYSICREFVVCI